MICLGLDLLRLGLLWLLRAHLGPNLIRLIKKLTSFGLSNKPSRPDSIILSPHKSQPYGLLRFKREVKVRGKVLLELGFQQVSIKQERTHVSILKISDLQMGFGQKEEKLSKKVIKEKGKGEVIFGSRAKKTFGEMDGTPT
jgi:hypothetical protein